MATEMIEVDGRTVETLRELLRPGLRVVVVGINPSPVSVAAGHYYQGKLGKRLWHRMQAAGLATDLAVGREDEDAFSQGVGFADIIRYPTANARTISSRDLQAALPDFERRIATTDCRRLLFVFAAARKAASDLGMRGYELFEMPGPYAERSVVEERLAQLRRALGPPPTS
jgi:TDG/mug DNA glycosylase family protein